MTTTRPSPARDARALAQRLQPDIAGHIRSNAVLALAADHRLTIAHLRRFVRSELVAQPAEVAAFAELALRTPPGSPQQDLFLGILAVIGEARPGLFAAAEALEMYAYGDAGDAPEGAMRYAELISWVGLNATSGAAAAALHRILTLWCAGCAELSRMMSLDAPSPMPEPVLAYIAGFAQAPSATIRGAEAVIANGIESGERVEDFLRLTGRAEQVLDTYWQHIAAA